jgi:ankyrin repeat protein
MMAVKQEDFEIGKLLLDKGSSLTSFNAQGSTAPHITALNGSRVFYKWLLEQGVDKTVRDNSEKTAADLVVGF